MGHGCTGTKFGTAVYRVTVTVAYMYDGTTGTLILNLINLVSGYTSSAGGLRSSGRNPCRNPAPCWLSTQGVYLLGTERKIIPAFEKSSPPRGSKKKRSGAHQLADEFPCCSSRGYSMQCLLPRLVRTMHVVFPTWRACTRRSGG
eukprot:SAG31_NODE_2890_length_4946_cov_19.418816_1_plen_145_part_00